MSFKSLLDTGGPVFCSSEQATDLLNIQFDTGAKFGNIMLGGIEQWVELNLHLTKQQLDNNLSLINKLDASQHQAISTEKINAPSEVISYPVTVYQIMLKTQTEIAKLIGQHFEELNQQAIKVFNPVQSEKIRSDQIVVNNSREHRPKAALKTTSITHRKNETRATGS